MPSFLGKAGVVDDPRLDRPMPLQRRQNQATHLGQNPFVRPRRVADEVQQGLMLGRYPSRRRHRRHRLDALAFTWHQQPEAVITQRHHPVGMTNRLDQAPDIRRKTRFTTVINETAHHTLGRRSK
jgi:hypothetical protein